MSKGEEEQTTDIFTKTLATEPFKYLRDKLGVVSTDATLLYKEKAQFQGENKMKISFQEENNQQGKHKNRSTGSKNYKKIFSVLSAFSMKKQQGPFECQMNHPCLQSSTDYRHFR